jgi:hypothetical protein
MVTLIRLVVAIGGMTVAFLVGSALYPAVGGIGSWIVTFAVFLALAWLADRMTKKLLGVPL